MRGIVRSLGSFPLPSAPVYFLMHAAIDSTKFEDLVPVCPITDAEAGEGDDVLPLSSGSCLDEEDFPVVVEQEVWTLDFLLSLLFLRGPTRFWIPSFSTILSAGVGATTGDPRRWGFSLLEGCCSN